MGVLSELRGCGVEDMLTACMDGYRFSRCGPLRISHIRVQLCIVHMIGNSAKYVSYKDLKKVCADLKAVYTAADKGAVRNALEEFGDTKCVGKTDDAD
jgi:transposase-like protein